LTHTSALRVFLIHVLFEGVWSGEDEAALTARNNLRDIDAVVVTQVLVKLLSISHLAVAEKAAVNARRNRVQLPAVLSQ